MEIISKNDIKKAFQDAGVSRGQIVYLQADLRNIGQIKGVKSREDFCRVYFESIFEIIGEEGTLVVPTYTTQVARFDIDFVWEETPSLMGVFSEFVRQHPGSLRSCHPLHSLCAVGKDKEFICKNNGANDFGWDSPFHRLLLKKAKILTIGLESGYVVGIAHPLEAACCLPYTYNKLLKWGVVVDGAKDRRQYFSTVRYLNINWEGYDLTLWAKHMRRLGGINSERLGGNWIHLSDYEQVFNEGSATLKDNPYFFLKESPNFEYGKIPFDGPTAQKDNIASKEDVDNVKTINWVGYYLLSDNYAGGDDHELEYCRQE
mgnify:CR=1 FL=1